MPADRPNIGTGRRRQASTEPPAADDSNRTLDNAIDDDTALDGADSAFDPGKQPGAHGATAPHHNVKPGTRTELEQARRDARQR